MVISNKTAGFNYFLLEKFTAGIVLRGTEIKSIRKGEANLKDSFAYIHNGEALVKNMHISPLKNAGIYNHEPERIKKLLLTTREIRKISNKLKDNGITLVPVKIFINEKGLCKMEIALAKGKKQYDKRETIKKRDAEREMKE
ncbi:MAG: SsrA-binding protein [Bacteroidetes bacterium RIFCSPLOWO2_02_FULL_36_8]|nr:MAG: SsrA-binding protein [Bacteroidetes bacterium RIFCSPLOWO2_02_FULL_36_8]OFY71691.1 MAG: SsrA-binding protein [Bacteroidetes bacterium RIFCSPLOWO2_12_FULL_37_12]